MSEPTADQQQIVQAAARGLARAGLVHAFGHCSMRLDAESLLVCAAMPMGMITNEPGTVVPINGPLPDGVLGEVRVHQQIYRIRPDVNGVCRVTPKAVMALSTQGITPLPRNGVGAFFAPRPPLWNDPRLLRNDESARGVAETLGQARAVVMRANGAVSVGATLPEAAAFAFFLEDVARIERDVRMMGLDPEQGLLDEDEIAARQTLAGGIIERAWAWLTAEPPQAGFWNN